MYAASLGKAGTLTAALAYAARLPKRSHRSCTAWRSRPAQAHLANRGPDDGPVVTSKLTWEEYQRSL
jgi:hypothetical protein